MKTLNLPQGSPEWHAHRAKHFNASDAPAVLNLSPYKTRAELLREMATGVGQEFTPAQQAILDSGHRFEALARPLAEKIIGEDLYPVVGVADEGPYSASFDGLTMLEDVAFEHKRLNAALREAMAEGCAGGDLPMHYQIQLEHQCLVSDSTERVLFMASDWDSDGNLIEARHCWYTPNLALRAKIVAGWKQFAEDLANYVPELPKAEPVVAAPQETLPSVSVQMNGQLAIVSNLPMFGQALREFINKIPEKPSTDQEFSDTEAACKRLKRAEEELASAEEHALAQMADVNAMRQLVKEFQELARTTRLQREKLVALRKEQIRGELVEQGRASLVAHIASLNKRLGKSYMPQVHADFAGVIKGKRTVDSLRDAINTELARAKIEANETADRIQANLNTLRELASEHVFLFADAPTIVLKANDDLEALVKSRIAEHAAKEAAKLEAQREQIRKEEAARLEREAEARRLKEERQAKAAAAEAERVRREALIQSAPEVKADIAEAVVKNELAAPLAQDIKSLHAEMTSAAASEKVISTARRAAAEPVEAEGPPTLRIGDIAVRLGWNMTAEQLRSLGIAPAAKERGSVLFHESQFAQICDAVARRAAEAKAEFSNEGATA